ncbi:MAG: tetratricopeptide repeat protein [Polyangiaceae bacterium]|nr:tetratricopeptide repeat protein [Polyangiaceae bacterium]
MFKMSLRALNRWTFACAMAVACASCAGSSQQQRDPDLVADPPLGDESDIENGAAKTDYQRAIAYIDKEHWAEAKVLLARVIGSTPENAEAHAYMGLVLEKENDLAGAEKSYLAALERKPGLAAAAQNLAAIYLTAQPPRVDDAIKHLEKAVALVPDDVGLLQNLGYARAAKGDVAGSAKAFQSAIAKADSVDLRLALANVYADAKQVEKAVPHAKKILEMAKDDPKIFVNVGFILEYGGAFAECVTAFDRAIKLKKDEPDWFVRRGRCKDELGNEDAALEDFQAAIKLKPDFAAGYFYSGVVQRRQQKLQSAEFSLQKAVEYGKDTPIGKLAAKKLRELQRGQ